jgi:mannose-6-phosphate isomerase-like protein (cupin superfamily)
MAEPNPSIRNIAEVAWEEMPGHLGGAFSKLLVHPDTTGSRHIDHRISVYQPRAHVQIHTHKVKEQVYHVLDGEGLMVVGETRHVVRRHDVVFIPPGVSHGISNTGLTDLVFIVVTSPVSDE